MMKFKQGLTSAIKLRTFSKTLVSSVFLINQVATGATLNVSNDSQLNSALASAQAGDNIVLSNGDYASLAINNRNFSNYVTITANNDNVTVSGISIDNSSYIRIDGLNVVADGREALGIFSGSHHIEVKNSDLSGSDQFNRGSPSYTDVTSFYAINVNDASDILIENVYGHDAKSAAFLFTGLENSIIRGNTCDWVAADCFKFSGADGISFENNFGARNVYSAPDAHVDFVQGQGDVSNSVFRGNIAIMDTRSFQGLFFDDAVFTNLTFENNLIYTSNIRGISVKGTGDNGIVARNNTVLIPPSTTSAPNKAALILLPDNSVSENNIVSNITTKNNVRFAGTNIIAQWDDDDDDAYYGLYYKNATFGPGATLEDFRPVAGSVAENQKGAFCRILEVLDGVACSQTGGNPSQSATPSIIMLLLDDDEQSPSP